MQHRWFAIFAIALFLPFPRQDSPGPDALLREADRLAWMKNWPRAESLYADAERLFAARGDTRNALYASVNKLRAQLPRLPVAEVSARLADYLDDPLVQRDDLLRLRCLVIKGETDTDLDPALAEQSWRDALQLATRLGEDAWANRANGELGLLAFLQGDINESVIRLGRALQIAQTNGDVASVVRWLTLFGHGYLQLGRAEQAIDYYEKALAVASRVPDLQFPVMTYLGKGDALASLGRTPEAERVLEDALTVATTQGALGYQAELTLKLGLIADSRGQSDRAADLLGRAVDLARQAGGEAILAEIAGERARIQRTRRDDTGAQQTLREGIDVARRMHEQMLLPKLLAQLGDLDTSREQYADAADRLDEASDLLEGLLTRASSPWVRSRIIAGMDEVFAARIRLEGSQDRDPAGMFAVVEQARGRSVLELLLSRPIGDVTQPPELRAGERAIAALQLKLFAVTGRPERRRLLEQIFAAEERLAPISTELFNKTDIGPRRPVALTEVQASLRGDELLLEFVTSEPASYCIAITRTTARLIRLADRSVIEKRVDPLLKSIRAGHEAQADARTVSSLVLGRMAVVSTRRRLIISPDGPLHDVPFELLVDRSGHRLLDSHVVSYVPSGSVLTILRRRGSNARPPRMALAVSASPTNEELGQTNGSHPSPLGAVSRSIYDLDGGRLPSLPSANDEARSVGAILGGVGTTVLVGDAGTELAVKHLPINEYRVLHFAVHGIVSSKFPARSALVLRPAGDEDGLFQAREILSVRLHADLVTLSACDTGSGGVFGEEGVSNLVRPFIAAGAKAVVANLWSADDTFSLAIMKEFYQELASGADEGEALRRAKLHMIRRFGPQAVPQLWSGLLIYGDSTARVTTRPPAAR